MFGACFMNNKEHMYVITGDILTASKDEVDCERLFCIFNIECEEEGDDHE
jgi:hypothetical protein